MVIGLRYGGILGVVCEGSRVVCGSGYLLI